MRRPQLNALLVGGLIAALIAGIGLSHIMQADSQPELPGLVLKPSREIADFSLLDQNGDAFNKAAAQGQWQLMFFGFTHCPDICPTTLAQMRQLRSDLPPAVVEKLAFNFVSIDPQRDSAAVLKEYVAYFDPSMRGVTGSLEAITDFADSIGIAFIKAGEGDDYNMDHATALILLDPDSRIKAYFAAPHKLGELHYALTELISP
ncbi:MAG: SCO family protein [Oceanococcus sp.]